ncbi:unnamed protein product [Ectocarpus sp. CCAP 1310/34]|nr:unnamed protein product [Ectocarpus sp. CCAP 1310/34]
MGRQVALLLAVSSVTLWWAAVDAFFAPTPPLLVGLEAQAGNTRIRALTTDRGGERITRTRCDATAVGGAEEEAEVVVIGSGIAGLCTAALLSSYGKKVVVCESHTQPGGCAHGFDRSGYKFDSGPSLFSGMNVDQPHAQSVEARAQRYWRGRGLAHIR